MSEANMASRMFAPLGQLIDFGGRTAPRDFWPYMFLLAAIYVLGFALMFASFLSLIGAPVADMFGLTACLILLACAAVVRRLHDVGWSGRWMATYALMACAFIGFFFFQRYGLTQDPYGSNNVSLFRWMPLLMLFSLAMNLIGLLVFVLCLLPGTAGPNRYGPDPRDGGAS
jgi:uncharacterized membrane protein YhaH (DUF805 family)